MALKIFRETEVWTVDQLVMVLYSVPGLGKTTLGFSSEKPLLLDFDGGAYRANLRSDVVRVKTWEEVKSITPDDLDPYETIVVDTAGRALDYLTASIIKNDYKMGSGGSLTIRGYGQLKTQFTGWLKALNILGKDVLLLAHSTEDKNGDDLIERLDIVGGSKNEIYKSADAMGRLSLKSGKRILNFSPTDVSFGKNPGNLAPLPVPEINSTGTFLAGVFRDIKEHLNEMTEVQRGEQAQLEGWVQVIDGLVTPMDFTSFVKDMQTSDNLSENLKVMIKAAFGSAVKESGFEWDKNAGCYKDKVEIVEDKSNEGSAE